jgi:hypothetical protein
MPHTATLSNPWELIAEQQQWWVPLAGWDTWADGLDLELLTTGSEKLLILKMPDNHAAAAAALLMKQLVSHQVIKEVMNRMHRTHLEDGGDMPSLAFEEHAAIHHAAATPLMQALCSRPQQLVHELDHPTIRALLARLDDALQPSQFRHMHDALLGHLLKRAAGHHLDLYSTLLRDGVPPFTALEVLTAI